MSIFYRYVIQEISKFAGIVMIAVAGIYVAVDFFERIDNFIEAGLPVSRTVYYLIFKIPFIIAQIFPVCMLLAVLIAFGLMSKRNEIIALKSSGVSTYTLLKPALLLGTLSCVLLFAFSEIVVPLSSARANRIWLKEVRKKPDVISKEKDIWRKDDQTITHISFYHHQEKALIGLTFYTFGENFKMTKRVDAKKGVYQGTSWQGASWVLFNVLEQVLRKDTGRYDVTFYGEKNLLLDFTPDDLRRVLKKPEEMSYRELREYADAVAAEGYDATAYQVDFHAKAAFPFICIILSMIGTAIGIRRRMKEGFPAGIATGIGIAFLYWVLYSFCLSLGYGKMLPPVAAAWAANLIFSCCAAVMLLGAE